jgi:DNA-binding transcriptional LysR family regulator
LPNDFANLVLAPLLAEFIQEYPAISLELDLSARRADILAEGLDAAIRFGELPDDATLAATPVYTGRHGLFAAPSYLARRGSPAVPEDLAAHDLLRLMGRNRQVADWVLTRSEERWSGPLPSRAAANSPGLLVSLARQGGGIVSAPLDFARGYVTAGELVAVLPGWAPPPITAWAVFPGRRLMPAKTRVFIDWLKAALLQG